MIAKICYILIRKLIILNKKIISNDFDLDDHEKGNQLNWSLKTKRLYNCLEFWFHLVSNIILASEWIDETIMMKSVNIFQSRIFVMQDRLYEMHK